MTNILSIRPSARADLPFLKDVLEQTGLFPPDMLDDLITPFLRGEGPDIWLTAEAQGRAEAFAFCQPERMTEGCWNLLATAVAPGRQGEGTGRALMAHVEHLLGARGERILLVETSGLPDCERTRVFYRRIGYTEEARIRDYYAAGEDKIVFRKSLALR